MKKSILFIMNSMDCGGAEKALLNLLNTLDFSKFDVDLFLFKHQGLFLENIPEKVNILPEPENYHYFNMPIGAAIVQLLRKAKIRAVINRGILGYMVKRNKNSAITEQNFWKYLSQSLPLIQKEYDIAIGFQEKNPIYFLVDHVKAKKKIGWIHTDLTSLNISYDKEIHFLSKLNYVVTVSEELVNILKQRFPVIENKIIYIKNVISPDTIRTMANEETPDFTSGEDQVSLITVGRLVKEKGVDLTLGAVTSLIKKGLGISWYIIGDGHFKSEIERAIERHNLSEHIKLLGYKSNPYPYIKKADIFIQTSRYEGKSISIEEAKILGKPILITNFATARSQIVPNVTGIITDMNKDSVAKDLEILINDANLRKELSLNLNNENVYDPISLETFQQMINH